MDNAHSIRLSASCAAATVRVELELIPPPPTIVPWALPLPPLPPVRLGGDAFPVDYAGGCANASYRRPRVWTVFLMFALGLAAIVFVGVVVPSFIVVAEAGGQVGDKAEFVQALAQSIQQPRVLLTVGAASQATLLLAALCGAILSPVPVVRRLRLNPSTLSFLGYLIVPIGGFAISVLFSQIVSLLHIETGGNLKVFAEAFRKLSPIEVAMAVLIVGIMPAFAEEFLFRGYMQTRLVQRWGRWVGIGITALLFGIMHMDPLQSPFALGFGFYIGYVVEKSGSVRPGMACHAFNNALQVILGRYAESGGGEQPQAAPAQSAVIALIAAAVIALCCLYVYFRVRPPEPVAGLPAMPMAGAATAM